MWIYIISAYRKGKSVEWVANHWRKRIYVCVCVFARRAYGINELNEWRKFDWGAALTRHTYTCEWERETIHRAIFFYFFGQKEY